MVQWQFHFSQQNQSGLDAFYLHGSLTFGSKQGDNSRDGMLMKSYIAKENFK